MSIVSLNCPRCGHSAESHLSIFSGLGPPRRRCGKCGKACRTDRREWADMGTWRRGWYVAYSLAAAVATGWLAWGMAAAAFGAARELADKVNVWRYSAAGALVGLPWGVLVLSIQVYRVSCSVRRSRAGRRVYDDPWWSLQTDVGLKVMGGVFASVALAGLIGLLSRLSR